MAHLPFQAVAFDLDDTFLRDDLSISARSVSTMQRLAGLGVRIIPASGRAQMSMKPFVDLLNCVSLYVSCNGAEIWDGSSHSLLHSEAFSVELGREIARFGKKHRCYAQTYQGEYFFYNEESDWAARYAASSMLKGRLVGDLEAFIQEPRCKILMMDTPQKIASMLAEAEKTFEGRVSVTCSKPWFLEFNPLYATKGFAIKWAAEHLGIKPESVIAFGDSLNDLSMLRAAGLGVLMANGRRELSRQCDDVCGTNQEDGVAVYLEKVFGEVLK